MAKDIIDVLKEMREKAEPYAVATVVETIGSISAKTGSKAVIDKNGLVVAGWVGGGCAESTACEEGLKNIKSGQCTVIDIDLDDEILGAGMPCGGSMRVYVEPVLPRPTLWLMGHGRVAEILCQIADLMEFRVIVNDPVISWDKYPAAAKLITDDIDYDQLLPEAGDFVVIATQHKGDHESMKRALASKAEYIALIASRKRSRLVLDYLRHEGFGEDDFQRVMAPCGLDLGAKLPEEIALSVMSEIVMVRRQGSGVRMREKLMMEVNLKQIKA
jgi:xanthine dehydrogenase accessory factor